VPGWVPFALGAPLLLLAARAYFFGRRSSRAQPVVEMTPATGTAEQVADLERLVPRAPVGCLGRPSVNALSSQPGSRFIARPASRASGARSDPEALLAVDPSSHRRVGREEVSRLFNPDFFGDRAECVSEGINRFLGFEDVEHAETVRPMSSRMHEQTAEGQVGWCFDPGLASQAPDDFFVLLLRQAWRLVVGEDQHYAVRSGPDSFSVEIGSACRWTIFHSPFSCRKVVVTRRSNGSTESRSPIRARQCFDLEDRRELVARVARDFVESDHLPIAHAARCVVERPMTASRPRRAGPNGFASVTSSAPE
jgi:hypothetical protein